MKIVLAHNFYQLSGGEDTVVANEKELLEKNGHTVIPFYKHNNQLDGSFIEKIKLLNNTSWSKATFEEMDAFLQKTKPDVCHVHNFFPLISPSIYDACIKNKVPVVQTLHNYRLICTNGLFLREGKVCEDCLTKSPMGSVLKGCYRNSIPQTFIVANMLVKNQRKNTWSTKVDQFLCLTDFAKEKFVKHGLPEDKLKVKPNFVHERNYDKKEGDYFVFVGRLEKGKGVKLLLEISKSVQLPIKVIGEGELSEEVSKASNIEFLGKKSHPETLEYIANARALLFPSIWYEGMPMTILEAFSMKTPVIASNVGAMQSMIDHMKSGILFTTNKASAFLEAINFALDNENVMKEISNLAFKEYKIKYSAEANYNQLRSLYQELVDRKDGGIKNKTLR